MSADPKAELIAVIPALTEEAATAVLAHVRALIAQEATAAATRPPGHIMTKADLYADLLPDDETADMMIETIRQWRREGGYV
jgi:anti-sigma factor ChrR (cupin superfamily)